MAITSASLPAKKRILTVCVRLFLEKGYKRSTLAEIIKKADVSYSTFQNIFRAKDGVLTELVEFMFSNQFAMARDEAGAKLPPVYVYAVETAIQMTLTELNENLREIYIEAYTEKEASEYILRETAKELHGIFGSYLPDATERDFYDMEIGSASIMRGYMAHPCDEELTLEKKLRLFLTMSLRAYNVPKEEVEQVIRFVEGLDIRAIAEQVMQKLFKALAMRYEFPSRALYRNSEPKVGKVCPAFRLGCRVEFVQRPGKSGGFLLGQCVHQIFVKGRFDLRFGGFQALRLFRGVQQLTAPVVGGVPADEVALRFQLLRLPGDFGDFPFRNIHGSLLRYIVVCATIVPCSIPGCHTELQLKSLEKILIARRARSSYETCFVISFLINRKTGSAIRRCLSD